MSGVPNITLLDCLNISNFKCACMAWLLHIITFTVLLQTHLLHIVCHVTLSTCIFLTCGTHVQEIKQLFYVCFNIKAFYLLSTHQYSWFKVQPFQPPFQLDNQRIEPKFKLSGQCFQDYLSYHETKQIWKILWQPSVWFNPCKTVLVKHISCTREVQVPFAKI